MPQKIPNSLSEGMEFELFAPSATLNGDILLNGSKSISNRLLIIYALCEQHFEIHNLSNAADTLTLLRLLSNEDDCMLDAGDAGTTFRFMTAYLAFRSKKQVLTGSARMLERPIAALVDALRQVGAKINYLRQEGFPPLQIAEPFDNTNNIVTIAADVSSQFISALLLIAPTLPQGLIIQMKGKAVSAPYIQMTLELMSEFGIDYRWDIEKQSISISPQKYIAKYYSVESDWSAASYYYAMAALSDEVNLNLRGLHKNSSQADACVLKLMRSFGIETVWKDDGSAQLLRSNCCVEKFDYNFINCPDIAQTFAVLCAGLNIPAHFTGLQTLKIKETDRIEALKTELEKLGAVISSTADTLTIHKGINPDSRDVLIHTYKDHRMAMAFAPLALKLPNLRLEDKNVVRKSYPNFWRDLQTLGFSLKSEKQPNL